MGIEIINPKDVAFTNKKRTVLMNTRKLHSWLISVSYTHLTLPTIYSV